MSSITDFCKIIAGVSFILGTLVLVLFLHSSNPDYFIGIGIMYTSIAIVINGMALIRLVVQVFINPKQWKTTLTSVGVLFINIPIAVL